MDGAVDGDDPAGGQSRQHPGDALEHLLHVGVADDAEAHQIAGRGQFGGSCGHLGRGVGVRLHRGGPARPQREVVTALDDPARHRAALAAQSDDSDSHQPASAFVFSCALRPWAPMHSSTNDNTRRWYSSAVRPTLRLCPLSAISLTTNRGDAVNNAPMDASASGPDSQTRSWSPALNSTGTRTRAATSGKSCRAQVAVTLASYATPGADRPPVRTSGGYSSVGCQSRSRNPAGRDVTLAWLMTALASGR